jgi:hypothetical protein
MRSVVAQLSYLFAIFIPITVNSSFLEDGIFDDTGLGAGMVMEDSPDVFASDDLISEVSLTDYAEENPISAFSTSSNDCSPAVGDFQTMGKARRGEVCPENGDYLKERPFVLPSFLLDATTIEPKTYCPAEIFEGAFPYLVCSSGLEMDLINYGLVYQALLNGQLGRFYSYYSMDLSSR